MQGASGSNVGAAAVCLAGQPSGAQRARRPHRPATCRDIRRWPAKHRSPAGDGRHAVVDLDDGAAVVIDAANGDLGAERKMIAGSGNCFTSKRSPVDVLRPTLRRSWPGHGAGPSSSRISAGPKSLAGMQVPVCCLSWPAGLVPALGRYFARRPDSRRDLAQQQATAERRGPPCDVRPPRSALRHLWRARMTPML